MMTLQIFDEEECKLIVNDFISNKNNIKLSTEHGVKRISSYEINVNDLSKNITDLIYKKIKTIILPITGGKPDMIFGVRYSLDTKSYMSAHYDCNSYSCIIKLNNEYEGGGTFFPLNNQIVNLQNIGDGLLFKSDTINSYHAAYPISNGTRYVLVIRIEKKNKFNFILNMLFLSFIDFFIRKFKPKLLEGLKK